MASSNAAGVTSARIEFGRGAKWRPVAAALLVVGAMLFPSASIVGAANPKCAVNTTTDAYVNPTVKRPGKSVKPTGVSSPAKCAFASITDAIEWIQARGLGTGARIILTGATATAPAVFTQEVFPLALPAGVTLTTTDDPALGGAGLNPASYVVLFGGAATHAISTNGASLNGVTVRNDRSSAAAAIVRCDTGMTDIDAVTLDGASAAGGSIAIGLHLLSGCDLDAHTLRVRGLGGDGIVVEEGADLTLDASKVHNNGGDGITIRGITSLSLSEIAFNGDDGILVESSTSSTFHGLDVRDNIGNGFEVHTAEVSFTSNRIHNNSRSTGWGEAQMLFVGPSDPYGVPYWTGATEILVYRIGADDCDAPTAQPNAIYSYDIADSREFSVGIFASGGAGVDADGNSWRTGVRTQDADQDASSFVDVGSLCPPGGILLIPDPNPGPPVE